MEGRRIDLGKSLFEEDDRNLLDFDDNSGIFQINLKISILFAENLEIIIIVDQSADESSKLIEKISNYRSLKAVFRDKKNIEIIIGGSYIKRKRKRKLNLK
jgi:hypothetical protein